MKKFFIFAIAAMYCLNLYSAQKLHTIIYADTNDEKIGKAAVRSEKEYGIAVAQLATALTWVDSPEPIVREGFDCNKQNLLQDIKNLRCDENDIVIFIYCGHGARGEADWSDFPQMCFSKREGKNYRFGEDFYPLENIHNMLMNKKPQMCVVIGDCCNSYDYSLSTKDKVDIARAFEQDIINLEKGEKCIRKLFLNKKGSVILTASIKGQYGWCCTNDIDAGMLLQKNFTSEIQNILSAKVMYDDWNQMLDAVKNNTYQMSTQWNCIDEKGKRWTQTPHYKVKMEEKKEIIPPVIIDTIQENNVRTAMLRVANDKKYSAEDRISMRKDVLAKYFDEDAIIDVVGIDGKTIILSTSAKKYMRKISVEENLTNIVILHSNNAENGKIKYMELHEIYTTGNSNYKK